MLATMNVIAQAVQQANADYPGGCPACKGVRFKTCKACGQETNSFHDAYYGRPRDQVYESQSEWREVNGEPAQSIPDRMAQP